MAYRVTLDLNDGSTVVYDNVTDYDVDDMEETPEEEDVIDDSEEEIELEEE